MAQRRPTVTEQTAKSWKATQLVGGLVLVAGLLLLAVSPAAGVVTSLLGAWTFIAGRLGAWWFHG